MKISKLKGKNVYGITETEIIPTNVNIITGVNKLGKTSMLDLIQTTLTNKGIRPRIVRNGELEAEMFIETDTGLSIDRKKRTEKSDYINVKDNGVNVKSPESYLQTLFSTQQFNPIRDFIDQKSSEKSKTLLSVCKINFPKERYIQEFGELPSEYDDNSHVLENLERIQSKKSKYYLDREETNRIISHKKASRDDLKSTLPENYDADTYRKLDISGLYAEYHKTQEHNKSIDDIKVKVELHKANLASVEGKFQTKVSGINSSYDLLKVNKQKSIEDIDEQIKQLELKRMMISTEVNGLDEKKNYEISILTNKRDEWIQETNESIAKYEDILSTMEPMDAEPLKIHADNVAKMKEFLRDYDKIVEIDKTIDELSVKSDGLTSKIEHARRLPKILLESAEMPIKGVTVENGEILINGLPIECLNEGDSYKIAIEIAKAKIDEEDVDFTDRE